MKGEGDFEERQYYAMGFNKYDLSDPLYDSKWKKLLRDEFWDKALPVTFVPEVPKPAGPPYMMYTYNSSAKAVKDQIMGKEFLNTIPFFFPTKLTRVQDNFNYRTAPLKGDEEESPKMRFIDEVEALQQARLDFVTGVVPRAWGAKKLYEQQTFDRQLDGSFMPLTRFGKEVQKGTYQDSIRDPNYLYNFGCLRLTPDLQYRTFKKGYEHLYQNVYCDKGLKNLLKCESAYASLISEEALPYEASTKDSFILQRRRTSSKFSGSSS